MSQGSGAQAEKRGLISVPNLAARREVGAILAVLGLVVVGTFINADVFWRTENIVGVVRNTATVSIIAYGMTLLIVSGEFDLSVGSWMGVSTALAAILFLDGWPLLLVIVLVLILSAVYGLFQGLLVTKLGLPSLIVTIGTLTLLRGVMLVVTDGVTISVSNLGPLFYLGGQVDLSGIPGLQIGQFPLQIIWMLLILGLAYHVLNKTSFGLRSQFTGGNVESARRTGVKTDTVKIINFMIVAALAAFAGISQLAFTRAVGPLTGQGIELTVIAAVVIGGTNLFGGEGSMPGTFLGALVFAITQNVLVLAGLGTQLFQIFSGLFIIVAVLIEVLSRQARPQAVVTQYARPLKRLLSGPDEFFSYVKTDVQGLDKPLGFLTISTLLLTVVTIACLLIGDALVPWEFDFLFIGYGLAAFGSVPVITFGVVTALALLTGAFLHAAAKVLGSDRDFDTTLQAVMYSFAPSVLLFVPILLSGWGFFQALVLGSALLVVLPILYLLYSAMRTLHDLETRNATASLGAMLLVWGLIATYVTVSIPG